MSDTGPSETAGLGRPGTSCGGDAARGFTLIEILVVVLVVAIMAAVTVVSLGGRDRQRTLQGEAERLQAVVGMARDRAVMGAREWGLELEQRRYAFLAWNRVEQRWEPVTERPFAAHTLPALLSLDLRITDERFSPDAFNDAGKRQPSLLILSSGEVTPFELRVTQGSGGAAALKLVSDGFARTEIARADGAG